MEPASDDHPGHQQDRPAERRPGDGDGRARGDARASLARRCSSPRPRRAIGVHGDPRGHRRRASRRRAADAAAPLRALVFDSHYDPYKGVVAYVRMVDGHAPRPRADPLHGDRRDVGDRSSWATSARIRSPIERAGRGEVGYVATGLKSVRECAGRRHAHARAIGRRAEPLPGYREPLPLVFAGIYPLRGDDYPELREALDKLQLNDAALRLRARVVGGAGLRVPLRVPGAAAHGDRPGAAGARVRPRPDRLGAERRVPRQAPSPRR